MRYIAELQEASQTEVVVGEGGWGAANCDMSNPCCVAIYYIFCNAKNEY
jgi:hypothetical protein